MQKDKSAVTYYKTGYATVPVHFANGDVTCQNCEYLYLEKGMNRCRCRLQRDKIIPIECMAFGIDEVGCPIVFEKGDDDNG